jgi:hypothetical protein
MPFFGNTGIQQPPHPPPLPPPSLSPPPPPPDDPMARQMTVDFLMGKTTFVLEEEEDKGTEVEGRSEEIKKLDVTSLQTGLEAMRNMVELM